MILRGKKTILRPIESEDLEFVRSLINDPDIEKTIVGWALPISRKDEEHWYASFSNTAQNIRYIITTLDGERVGMTGLGNIDMKNGCAKGLGIRIAQNAQSKGLATDAYMTMFNFAFNELRLHRIETSAFDDNLPSLKFQEKLGCKREGFKREAAFKNGEYKNIVTFGCLKNDFVPIHKAYINS
ncbi:MAG: GNAT family N-acetyltransferase [Phocaeicola sp.]